MEHINDDIDYVWNLDSDEIYKSNDLKKIIDFLEKETPTSVGIRSCSFYGGFDYFLTGFELKKDNFLRIFKYIKGSTWLTHRPPTIKYPEGTNIVNKHVDSNTLYDKLRVQMYHYSYVFPDQVYTKVSYYKDSVSKDLCIDNYFTQVYIPWMIGNRNNVEEKFYGVHEFKPQVRGECYTDRFSGTHPESIQNNIDSLTRKIKKQLRGYHEL